MSSVVAVVVSLMSAGVAAKPTGSEVRPGLDDGWDELFMRHGAMYVENIISDQFNTVGVKIDNTESNITAQVNVVGSTITFTQENGESLTIRNSGYDLSVAPKMWDVEATYSVVENQQAELIDAARSGWSAHEVALRMYVGGSLLVALAVIGSGHRKGV